MEHKQNSAVGLRPHVRSAAVACLMIGVSAVVAAQDDSELLSRYRTVAMGAGNAQKGMVFFESTHAACRKCHTIASDERLTGGSVYRGKLCPSDVGASILQ